MLKLDNVMRHQPLEVGATPTGRFSLVVLPPLVVLVFLPLAT
jgi:hypothetical protein